MVEKHLAIKLCALYNYTIWYMWQHFINLQSQTYSKTHKYISRHLTSLAAILWLQDILLYNRSH